MRLISLTSRLVWIPGLLLLLVRCHPEPEGIEYTGVGGAPVPLAFEADVPLVEASVDGAPAVLFALDTGSPVTVLSPGPGRPDGTQDRANLELLGITALGLRCAVLDLFGGELGVGGLVGGDLLSHFGLTLDYRAATATLHTVPEGIPPESGDDPGAAVSAGFSLKGGGLVRLSDTEEMPVGATRVVIDLEIEGRQVTAVVDTGASLMVISESLMDDLMDSRPERPLLLGLEVITVDGRLPVEVTRLASVSLREAPLHTLRTSVPALAVRSSPALAYLSEEVGQRVDLLAGGAYLRLFSVTLDYPGRRLWLAPYGATPHVDPDEYVTVGFLWDETPEREVVIDSVLPGTDADLQGLLEGDRILSAESHEATALGEGVMDAALAGRSAGDPVTMTLARGGEVWTTHVLVEDLLPHFE